MHDIARLFRNKDVVALRALQGGQSPQPKREEDDTLYRFDSGATLTFAEGSHNVLAIGGVGRGKTASIVLPMAARCIRAGLPGLVIDVKNNLTDQIRALARRYGREADVVELGTHPSAERLNLLHGQPFPEIERLLTTVITHRIGHTLNVDWTFKGVRIATDIAYLLVLLAEAGQHEFQPSFALIAKMLGDYHFSRRVFNYFRRTHYDAHNHRHVSFVTRMTNDAFHPLNERLIESTRGRQEWDMQLSWMLHQPRRVLEALCRDEALFTHFSHPDGGLRIDFQDLLYRQRRIVVIRFGIAQNDVGNLIAKWLKEKFYKDIYERFDNGDIPSDLFTFLLLDEFQDILDVDDHNALDDFSWFSKSREFRNINIAATQALSSLYLAGQRERIDGLVANCSAKLLMQTDDPAADVWFRHFYEFERPLHKLTQGECVLAKFDLRDRRLHVTHEHVQEEYERTRRSIAALITNSAGHTATDRADYLQRVKAHEANLEKVVAGFVDAPAWLKEPHLLEVYYRYWSLWDFKDEVCLDFPLMWLPPVEEALRRLQSLNAPVRLEKLVVADGELLVQGTPEHALRGIIGEAVMRTSEICMHCGRVGEVKMEYSNGRMRVELLCEKCREPQAHKRRRGRA